MEFGHNHYVPCLRWKMGEYQAVLRLHPATKRALTPLIDIPEIGWDFATRSESKSLDEHLAKFASRIHGKWGLNPCFVDGRLLSPTGTMATGLHVMCSVFDDLRLQGCQAVPVTGPERIAEYQVAVREVVATDRHGACIRLPLESALGTRANTDLEDLLDGLDLQRNDAHLVLDIGAPANFEPISGFAKLVQAAIRRILHLRRWRTFTLLGSSIPKTMGDVATGPSTRARSEWLLYKEVMRGLQEAGQRLATFADYAVQHPDVWQTDMRKVKPSASIKYSANDIWFILKGANIRDNGLAQYRDMCKALVSSPYFSGEEYSYGDKYISECAAGSAGTGNMTTWCQIGTNHHLERVVRDVSSLFAS